MNLPPDGKAVFEITIQYPADSGLAHATMSGNFLYRWHSTGLSYSHLYNPG
jgi:hypothetical protein